MTFAHAWRSLRRTPIFTMAAIVSLTLGISAVGSMFAIVYGVLLAPLPYGEPERLVSVGLQTPLDNQMKHPAAAYFTYRQPAHAIEDVALYRSGTANLWIAGADQAAERVSTTWVTASMMPLLRVAPLLGRAFTADEEFRGGPEAVILSESVWRSRFDASPAAIGKTLIVNSVPRQVIGIMPARFAFPSADTQLWLPVKHTADISLGDFFYSVVARLAEGASVEQAQRDLAGVMPSLADAYPRMQSGQSSAAWLDEVRPTPVVQPLRDNITAGVASTLWMLAAAASLVLLVAWANVANLMLIRADGRQRELAVRETLGGGRLSLAAHFVGESLLLGAAAAALAMLLTVAAISALVALGPADIPRLAELRVGLAAVSFIAVIAAVGAMICAAVPTARLRRASLSNTLRDGGRGESASKTRTRLRTTITAMQIAIALVVSLGSALLLRTAYSLSQVEPGFDATNVTTVWTLLPFASYREATAVAFHARLTERVAQLPSVSATGLTTHLPLGSTEQWETPLRIEGEPQTRLLPVNVVDSGYFGAMRIPLLAGRNFQRLGVQKGDEIVISQRAAAALFNDASGMAAVGKRLTRPPSGPSYTIIGVVGDVRDQDLATPPSPMIYRPQAAAIDPSPERGAVHAMALVVRSSGSPETVVAAIRQIVRDLDPTVPMSNVESMSDVVRASTARLSLTLTLMTAAAATTLLLGAIGLYGVMAYMVALRTREFGIRIALGASPKRIARWVAMRGLLLTATGLAVGFVLYAASVPLLRAFLYGVTATDPVTLTATTLALVATASLACWIPAMRAAQIDPAEALRAD